jgi:hypothetical protein
VQVSLLGPPIQYVDRLPYILSQYAMTGLERFDSRKFIDPKLFEFDAFMKRQFGAMAGVHYLSVLDTVCEQGKCPVLIDGSIPVQWDMHHLTAEGSVLVAEKLLPRMVPDFNKTKR